MQACNHKQQTHQPADGYIGPHTMDSYMGDYFPQCMMALTGKKEKVLVS